jgi:3-dehydroquinate dehydratase-2
MLCEKGVYYGMKISIINGPNMQLLGKREPDIYGSETLADLESNMCAIAEKAGCEVDFFQSNHEGDIVDKLGTAAEEYDAVIINPAAYTHTSVAIRDAIKAIGIPVIEVHLSNITEREDFRHTSLTAPVCIGQICGFGLMGYEMAFSALEKIFKNKT